MFEFLMFEAVSSFISASGKCKTAVSYSINCKFSSQFVEFSFSLKPWVYQIPKATRFIWNLCDGNLSMYLSEILKSHLWTLFESTIWLRIVSLIAYTNHPSPAIFTILIILNIRLIIPFNRFWSRDEHSRLHRLDDSFSEFVF